MPLRALARVDVAAVERNCGVLARAAAPAVLCAVVKADGYGHGAAAAARAAQAGGAAWLAVATAGEAAALRAAGIDGPVLVMGALSAEELEWRSPRGPTSWPGARASSPRSPPAPPPRAPACTSSWTRGWGGSGRATRPRPPGSPRPWRPRRACAWPGR